MKQIPSSELELRKEFDQAKRYLEDRKDIMAARDLERLIIKDPKNQELWLYLGIAQRRLESYESAINCFRKVVDINTKSEEAWGLLTVTLIDQGNIEKAKKTIEEAGRLNPSHEQIQFLRYNLVRIYTKFGPFF